MFDMTSEAAPHLPGGNRFTVLLSSALHVIVLGALVIVSVPFASDRLPDVASMTAFVVAAAPAPSPPPPVQPRDPMRIGGEPVRVILAVTVSFKMPPM